MIEFWLKQSQPTCLYHSSARHIWVRNGREILPLNIKYLNCHTHSSNSPPLSFNPEQLSIFPINVVRCHVVVPDCCLLEVEPILKGKHSGRLPFCCLSLLTAEWLNFTQCLVPSDLICKIQYLPTLPRRTALQISWCVGRQGRAGQDIGRHATHVKTEGWLG